MKSENSSQLLEIVNNEGLGNELYLQLQKDFSLANNPLNIHNQQLPLDIVSIIKETVYFLIMERFQEYLNLMYIIDVAEKEFRNIVVTDTVAVAEQVTFLILKREYQKVYLRKKYS